MIPTIKQHYEQTQFINLNQTFFCQITIVTSDCLFVALVLFTKLFFMHNGYMKECFPKIHIFLSISQTYKYTSNQLSLF